MSLSNNELAEKLTVVIAQSLYNYEKCLLHEPSSAEDYLTGWRQKYNPPRPDSLTDMIEYNVFKYTVDAAVANIMWSMRDE